MEKRRKFIILKFEVGDLIKVSSRYTQEKFFVNKSLSKIPVSAITAVRIRADGQQNKNRVNKVKTVCSNPYWSI